MEKAQRLLETHLEMIPTHSAFCIRSPPSPIFLKGLFEKVLLLYNSYFLPLFYFRILQQGGAGQCSTTLLLSLTPSSR